MINTALDTAFVLCAYVAPVALFVFYLAEKAMPKKPHCPGQLSLFDWQESSDLLGEVDIPIAPIADDEPVEQVLTGQATELTCSIDDAPLQGQHFQWACPLPQSVIKVATDFSNLNPVQLRQECQKRRIKWRDAHGKNKHLRKTEMIAALLIA